MDMQPVEYDESILKITLKNINILKKVNFQLKYQTTYGQAIFVYGNHPLLGNNLDEKAIPMTFINESYWELEINFSNYNDYDKITYHYFILNPDGTKVFDWGDDKGFHPNRITTTNLELIDTWNYLGYAENVFYTEPFVQVLLQPSLKQQLSNGIQKSTTHIFRVKAPLIESNQTLCVTGSSLELGKWDVKNPILLNKITGADYFEVSLDLVNATFPLEYKFGVYDMTKQSFIGFEKGDNRILNKAVEKNKLTILHDGFAQLHNDCWKATGVSIPVFSLRSEQSAGVGEFSDLKYLVDWSKKIGLKLIQLLPLNDTTAKHSWLDSYPYAAISAFALHPMYVSLQQMLKVGQENLLAPFQQKIKKLNSLSEIDYDGVMQLKWKVLKLIYIENGKKDLTSVGFKNFFKQNEHWLISYSAFSYLRDLHGTVDFNSWPTFSKFDQKEIDILTAPKSQTYQNIAFYYFVQYHLHLQLSASSKYAHENGVVLKGDIPIGVYRYGADTWQHPDLFHMDMQAGAPPDDFAIKGQNWGFPTYHWEAMASNHYKWWKLRFEQMSYYFDAFRIDHILGFFRIWSIPIDQVEGIMGRFIPSIPLTKQEFEKKGISFYEQRLIKPFITEAVLFHYFGYDHDFVKQHYVKLIHDGQYELLTNFQSQSSVVQYFKTLPNDDWHQKIKSGLFNLISNVILFKGAQDNEYHFRFNAEATLSFQYLDEKIKKVFRDLYIQYFFIRQDKAWKKEALQKLPMLKKSTNMLICGEDLGLVPECVPQIMQQLGILSLEVQRMPKVSHKMFFHPNDAPYLSVVTPSSHDTSTIRGWWEEDKNKTQHFYNHEIGQKGQAPEFCEPWINKAILSQHLNSPAIWAIFQLQDFLGINANLRRNNPKEEQINVPANPNHYWCYRMHISLESLLVEDEFNNECYHLIKSSGR